MAVGIAGAAEGRRLKTLRALIASVMIAAGAGISAAQAPAPADGQRGDADVAKISPVCDAPFGDIATPTPLPELTQALEGRKPIRVLSIGSSSTVGVGASKPANNYPNQLGGILRKSFAGLDLTVINKGVSGEVAGATAERMRTLVALEKPTLVLWQVGTNDALARVPIEDFRTTVRDTVRWLKSHSIDVVLVGLQYTPHVARDEHYHAVRKALAEVASEEQVLLVRRFAAMEFLAKVKGNTVIGPDDLHLNDLGYRCMAEHIARAMVVSHFMRRKRLPVTTQ